MDRYIRGHFMVLYACSFVIRLLGGSSKQVEELYIFLVAQTFSGHAFATEPPVFTLFLD